MSKEDAVKAVGFVVRLERVDAKFGGGIFAVDLPDQEGEHRSGTRHEVIAQTVQGRAIRKLRESGQEIHPGNRVLLLVEPGQPNPIHICPIIAVVR